MSPCRLDFGQEGGARVLLGTCTIYTYTAVYFIHYLMCSMAVSKKEQKKFWHILTVPLLEISEETTHQPRKPYLDFKWALRLVMMKRC